MRWSSPQIEATGCRNELGVESLGDILPRLLERYGICDEQAVPQCDAELDTEVELELVA